MKKNYKKEKNRGKVRDKTCKKNVFCYWEFAIKAAKKNFFLVKKQQTVTGTQISFENKSKAMVGIKVAKKGSKLTKKQRGKVRDKSLVNSKNFAKKIFFYVGE